MGNDNAKTDRIVHVDHENNLIKPKPSSAIDEETGEINWDCPCLAGALEPPCGEFFRDAFTCFVASKTEPKGTDCLELFTRMQDCFRAHPDIYMKDENIKP